MGLLRIILALCVVFTHSPNSFEIPFLNGRLAVQTFYIISGFYMTLILKEKYIGVNNSYKLYITNRLMRLFPIYWFVLVLTLFLYLTIFIYSLGLNYDPWSYRFFPTELLFFLLGTISYHIYKNISNNILPKIQLQAILCGAIGFTFFYSYLSFPFLDKVYILFLVVSIPFIFFLTKNSQLDRYIGDLSYPVYISHILIINTLVYLDISILKPSGIIVSIMSILISVLINKFFANKFERYRQNRLISKQ